MNLSSDVTLTFYGCRGSYPVSGTSHLRYGGATSCVVVSAAAHDIILDAGSGIVQYGQTLMSRYAINRDPINAHLFLTHTHFDHLLGLPFFPPLFMTDATVSMWGPRTAHFDSLEDTLTALIRSPFYPVDLHEMHALKHFYDVGEADVVYFFKDHRAPLQIRPRHPSFADLIPCPDDIALEVHCLRGYNHPKCGINFYKIMTQGKTIVYATDTEGYVHGDRRLAQFAHGADILIHDAMYTDEGYTSLPVPTQGYGHSTVGIATALAAQANAKQLVLFHHNPSSDDDILDKMGQQAKKQFANVIVAHDGLTVPVT